MRVLTIFNFKKFLLVLSVVTISSFLYSQKKQGAQKANFILVLDAGHGGHDNGAMGYYANEKDVTLSLVLKVGALIEKNYKDVKVIYTRKTDVFIPLMGRADVANRNGANFFMSIHCNSAKNRSAYGTETFVLGTHRNKDNFEVAKRENEVIYLEDDYKTTYGGFNPSSPEDLISISIMQQFYLEHSLKMANMIENNFVGENRISRGVKQAGFLVLVQTAMPSVLIEVGFISNDDEGSYLASDRGQKSIAQNIYDAFVRYKKEFDKKSDPSDTGEIFVKEEEKPVKNELKVRFLTSFSKYNTDSPKLRGLKNVEVIKESGKYIYYTGSTNLQSESESNLKTAIEAGFTDAKVEEIDSKENVKNGYYSIEVLLSTKKYKERDPVFRGLNGIIRDKINNVYTYSYGKVTNYNSAIKLLNNIKKLGFVDAVIIKVNE